MIEHTYRKAHVGYAQQSYKRVNQELIFSSPEDLAAYIKAVTKQAEPNITHLLQQALGRTFRMLGLGKETLDTSKAHFK